MNLPPPFGSILTRRIGFLGQSIGFVKDAEREALTFALEKLGAGVECVGISSAYDPKQFSAIWAGDGQFTNAVQKSALMSGYATAMVCPVVMPKATSVSYVVFPWAQTQVIDQGGLVSTEVTHPAAMEQALLIAHQMHAEQGMHVQWVGSGWNPAQKDVNEMMYQSMSTKFKIPVSYCPMERLLSTATLGLSGHRAVFLTTPSLGFQVAKILTGTLRSSGAAIAVSSRGPLVAQSAQVDMAYYLALGFLLDRLALNKESEEFSKILGMALQKLESTSEDTIFDAQEAVRELLIAHQHLTPGGQNG